MPEEDHGMPGGRRVLLLAALTVFATPVAAASADAIVNLFTGSPGSTAELFWAVVVPFLLLFGLLLGLLEAVSLFDHFRAEAVFSIALALVGTRLASPYVLEYLAGENPLAEGGSLARFSIHDTVAVLGVVIAAVVLIKLLRRL